MSEPKQFFELVDPQLAFENCLRSSLETLLPDLARMPWYVRERQVVNLFVLHHLLPSFQAHNPPLYIRQIGIEVPVWKSPTLQGKKEVYGVYADIAVWPHVEATNWRTCRPLAWIEWKNISCVEKDAAGQKRAHKKDICRLQENLEWSSLIYAVVTWRRNQMLGLSCTKIEGDKDPSKSQYFWKQQQVSGSGDESLLCGGIESVWSKSKSSDHCNICRGFTNGTGETRLCWKLTCYLRMSGTYSLKPCSSSPAQPSTRRNDVFKSRMWG